LNQGTLNVIFACGTFDKAKLVKQEQQAIDAQYEKKRKGAEVAQKMYELRYICNLLH
jgi:hypothetical protein